MLSWNPVVGCSHGCHYCWCRKLALRLKAMGVQKYADGFQLKLFPWEFQRRFRKAGLVFVVDMGDLFCSSVPDEWISQVIQHVQRFPRTDFLFLTKNPSRYLDFRFPPNSILGATIETNRDELASRYSNAPAPSQRYRAMAQLEFPRKLICMEPIMDFDLEVMLSWIERIQPQICVLGYDNYGQKLPEPPLAKLMELRRRMHSLGIQIWERTLRKAWNER